MKRLLCFVFILIVANFLTPLFFAPSAFAAATGEENLLCWKKEVCQKDTDGNGTADGRWDNQSEKAIKSCGGGQWGYCYPQPEPFTLNVSIPLGEGEVKKTVTGFGDYINTFYRFLIGASATIAVVLIMVAGAQYVASSGSGEVGKAKEKIKNAVTGFVLLMLAVLLLQTVNPQLLKLEPPPFPKVRQSIFYGEDTTCEFYLESGHTLETTDGTAITEGWCGVTADAKVATDPNGNPVADTTCKWTSCDMDKNGSEDFQQHSAGIPFTQYCMEVSGKPKCVSCQDATTGPDYASAVPSEGVCNQLQPDEDVLTGQYNGFCQFSRDIGFEPSEWLDSKVNGQCAAVAYDCSTIKECDDYEEIKAENDDGSQSLKAFEAPGYIGDYSVINKVCETNICGIAGGCKLTADSTFVAAKYFVGGIYSLALDTATSWLLGTEATGINCEPK